MYNNMQFRNCPNCGKQVNVNLPSCWNCRTVFYQQNTQQMQQQSNFQQPQNFQYYQSTNTPNYIPQTPNYNQQVPPVKKKRSCLADIFGSVILITFFSIIGNCFLDDIEDDIINNNVTVVESEEDYNMTEIEKEIDVTIDEKIIYEENNVIVKVTGIDDNKVSFYIENNSTLNLGFNMHSYAVNGIMTNQNIFTMDVDVAANSKNKCTLEIPNTILTEYDVDVIKNLTLHIWAYNNDAYMKEFDCGSIFIETSASDGTNNIQSGEALLDENGLKYELIKTDGNIYYIGITNTNSELCEIDMQNLVINDWTCDITYNFDLIGLQILPNCQNIISLDLTEYLNEKNISNIEYISFNFDVRPNADYFNSYIGSTIKIEK